MSSSDDRSAWVRAMPAVFVLIWSTGFIVARLGMPHSPPFTFLLMRYLLSMACFVPWILWAKVPWPQNRQQFLHLSVTGILIQAGYLGGVWAAVKSGMGSGLSALIVGIQPVLTAIWLSAMQARSQSLAAPAEGSVHISAISARQWLGLMLGLAGLLMVVWRKLTQGSALDHVNFLNISFAVMALLCITAGTLYQKRYCPSFDLRAGSVIQFVAAFALLLPLALMTETMHVEWSMQFVFAIGWLALVLSIGAVSLLFVLIKHGEATRVSSLFYLTPLATAAMAWFAFEEHLNWMALAGMVIGVTGVALVLRRPDLPATKI